MKRRFAAQHQPARGLRFIRTHAFCNRVVNRGNQVAEDAAKVALPGGQGGGNAGTLGCIRRGDVGKRQGVQR